jgi:hypothetical protein
MILTQYFHKYPNTLAILLGLVSCFILISAIEGCLKIFKFSDASNEVEFPDMYYEKYDFGVKKPQSGRNRSTSISKKTGKAIYNVEYSVDEYGRRITPIKNRKQRNKFVLFFGGSFTYGEGVEDNQTLPFGVGNKASQYTAYNYGFHGLGPFDVLAKIENLNFYKEVKEKHGILIYTYIDGHIHRTAGSMVVMGWMSDGVYYRNTKDEELVRDGSFETGRPILTAIYKILNKSEILKVLKINFPIRFKDRHIKLVAETITKMQKEFKKKYPHSSFYVLIYPGSRYGKKLMEYLDQQNILYLNYTTLFNASEPRYYLVEEDLHPSPLAYQTISGKIVEDLNLK